MSEPRHPNQVRVNCTKCGVSRKPRRMRGDVCDRCDRDVLRASGANFSPVAVEPAPEPAPEPADAPEEA